jgi:hypothetical protein
MLTLALAIGLGACEREATRIDPPTTNTVPTNTAAQSALSSTRPPEDASDPAKGPALEGTEPKGAETGTVGAASGTVASGGSTGTAESSSERIEKK